jgi:hypothetical protein
MERRCQPPLPRRLLAAGRSARQGVEHCRIMAAMRSNGSTDALVCTENLNPDVVMVKPAEDRV